MNKEYYSKIEELFQVICEERAVPSMRWYGEIVDIIFHYMSCHINNSVYKCMFLDEYENIRGTRKHEDILKAIDDMYNEYKNL